MVSKFFVLVFSIVISNGLEAKELSSASSIMKTMEKDLAAKSAKIADKRMCENFEGSWKGVCTDSDNNTLEEWINIGQFGCGVFDFSGEGYFQQMEIGKIERIGSTNLNFQSDFQATGHIEWDIARKVLKMVANGSFHTINGESGILKSMTSFEIADGQLKTRYSSHNQSTNSNHSSTFSSECQYSK